MLSNAFNTVFVLVSIIGVVLLLSSFCIYFKINSEKYKFAIDFYEVVWYNIFVKLNKQFA